MSLPTISGVVMIIGSLMFIVAAAPMSGIYGEKSLEDRLTQIAAKRSAFIISQLGFGLGGLATAIGFLLLSIGLRETENVLLPAAAAAVLLIGAVLWAIFIYQRTIDPASMFGDYLGSRIMWVSFAFTEVGLVLYGVLFLQGRSPDWLGYVCFAVAGLMLIGALTIPTWLPPQIIYVLTLIVGIVHLGL